MKLKKIVEKACPEFLNQEIGLTEVLRTFEQFSDKVIVFSTDGRFGEIKDVFKNGFIGKTQWDLSENLDGQKSEILNELYSLLEVKNETNHETIR